MGVGEADIEARDRLDISRGIVDWGTWFLRQPRVYNTHTTRRWRALSLSAFLDAVTEKQEAKSVDVRTPSLPKDKETTMDESLGGGNGPISEKLRST